MTVAWTGLRATRKLLRGIPVSHPDGELRHRCARLTTAYVVVRAFYALMFFDSFVTIAFAHRWVAGGHVADPLWVVSWLNLVPFEPAVRFLALGYVAVTMLAMVFPDRRWARILVALFALSIFGVENSFGAINHLHHFPLWLSLVFAFLPSGGLDFMQRRRALREHFLTVFFLGQVTICLFYSLSGFYKIGVGLFPAPNIVSAFMPEALSRLIITRWLETGEQVFFEQFLVDNLWITWPAYLAVIYLEFVALVAVFRPQLHFWLGIAFAGLHLSIWLFMGIVFRYQPVLAMMLFVWSPFRPERMPGVRETLLQLPILGDVARLLFRANSRRTSVSRLTHSPAERSR